MKKACIMVSAFNQENNICGPIFSYVCRGEGKEKI